MTFDYSDAEARTQWRSDNWPLDSEATDQVSTWIINDGAYYEDAQASARAGLNALEAFTRAVLNNAPHQSAPWHTRRALSDIDMERIDWWGVAEVLLCE